MSGTPSAAELRALARRLRAADPEPALDLAASIEASVVRRAGRPVYVRDRPWRGLALLDEALADAPEGAWFTSLFEGLRAAGLPVRLQRFRGAPRLGCAPPSRVWLLTGGGPVPPPWLRRLLRDAAVVVLVPEPAARAGLTAALRGERRCVVVPATLEALQPGDAPRAEGAPEPAPPPPPRRPALGRWLRGLFRRR